MRSYVEDVVAEEEAVNGIDLPVSQQGMTQSKTYVVYAVQCSVVPSPKPCLIS